MTDERNPDEIGEVDWDEALAEWENTTFRPKAAGDSASSKPTAANEVPTPSRPFYRPPPSGAPGPATAIPPPLVADLPDVAVAADDDGEATLIARIPEELLRREEPRAHSRRGGLGQLFSRDATGETPGTPRPPTPRPASDPPEEVVTSAKAVPSGADPIVEPLRRAPRIDVSESVPDGALFDPFTEPRPEMRTLPATDEIVPQPLPQFTPSARLTSSGAAKPSHPPPIPAFEPFDGWDEEETTNRQTPVTGPISEPQRERPSKPPPAHPSSPPSARRETPPVSPSVRPSRQVTPVPPRPAEIARSWADEKPACEWLDEAARSKMQERVEWLEREARALADKTSRARALLTCSELAATAGDRERAHTLASEARDLAPTLVLAHRQARALLAWPVSPAAEAALLDAESKMAPAGPVRLHATLGAAEAFRAAGDDASAAKRLDQAVRAAPADLRAPVARAARAIADGDLASLSLRVGDGPELAPLAAAIGGALRLRGADAKMDKADDDRRTPNEAFLLARRALENGDVAAAAAHVAALARVEELASGALWLAAALAATTATGRRRAFEWLTSVLELTDDPDAARALVVRAFELGDADRVGRAAMGPGPLTAPERVAFAALAGVALDANDPRLEAAAATPGMSTLANAVAAVASPAGASRHARASGTAASRAAVALGRSLAAQADAEILENLARFEAVTVSPGVDATVRGVRLELAHRHGRATNVSTEIEAWGAARGGDDVAGGAIAAGLVAERFGFRERALDAYRAAHGIRPQSEATLRAVAALEPVDLVFELSALADELGPGLRSGLLRLEAAARAETLVPEPTRAQLLEAAHHAAPGLPIASFLAERIARRAGDLDEVVRWIRERREHATDPIERALDSVREALLVADHDPALAGDLLREAHLVRRSDIALRELYERMATETVDDRAAWREERAAEVTGEARALLYLEAAHEYERAGDEEGAFRCAIACAMSDASLTKVARERAELRTGRVARLADELFASAKAASTATERCEAYERLAALDATARHDTASALLWHRSVLEEIPDHTPSLRYIEHQLIGDGRSDELEPVLSAIARCLRGSGPGERTAHAEMAARLRMRDEAGGTTSAFEMIALAAAETDPSLWSLRMFEAHARTTGDDAALLDVCKRLVDRSTRSTESAALLLRAGEAAMRLDRHDEARALLQRATVEDSGDVVAWWLLAEVRRRAGDARAAAEACEALARCSGVRQHQLIAWFDAGRLWLDEVHDEERALVALEAAAAIDVTHFDVFDRLSRLYASRRMQPELAELLERRLERVGDPDERRTIEVRRGRALLEAGEADGARRAFEAALKSRADDPDALSAFADLCIAQNDWNAAEQALVRLARLLPTAEEQRGVYARLGELYSHRLLNLSRAEVALKEVLRRAPDDVETTQKLVEVYKRQNDPARAVELQQELVDRAQSPEDRRDRVLELAAIHEKISRDVRRAEKTLESARRDLPHDVVLLRALAEFYTRHHQTPAVHMLLDRASADARRALGAGRIASPPFEILAAVAELRNKPAAALAASAMLAAVEGRPVEAHPGGARALSREFDELVAPETLTAGIRALFEKAGDALESAAPFDLREARATPLAPEDPVALFALRIAAATGLGGLQVFSSPRLGAVCLPVGAPPALVFGEALLTHENAAQFLALRAVKLVRAHAAALGRGTPSEVAVLVSAWLKAFVPAWQPQGITTTAMNSILPRVQAALPRTLDTDVPMLALEASAALDGRQATVGAAAVAWANRAALVALGDPAAALDAIAIASGLDRGAPTEPRERAAWIARTPEARDLVAFGVTDAYAELRARLES